MKEYLLTISSAFLFLIGVLTDTVGQIDNSDHILWAGAQIRKQIDPNWGFQLQPIIRYNNDISDYQNTSIDYSLRRKLNNHWHVQVLGRTWFMPDRADRQFLWIDIGRGDKIFNSKINLTNRIRWHNAFDIGGFTDPDFIRYMIQFVPNTNWKVKPRFGFEPWLQLNGFNSIRRLRFEPGLMFQFSPKIGLTTIWRRQNDINREMNRYDNLWVVALVLKV